MSMPNPLSSRIAISGDRDAFSLRKLDRVGRLTAAMFEYVFERARAVSRPEIYSTGARQLTPFSARMVII